MWGKDIFCKRNGYGIQEWSDGCKYEGDFVNNLKHGTGVFTWANGEFYKGSFFKDYRHGKGMYSWPDGSKYTGKFYLNRKEGYGVQVFSDGSTFEGLYHADERFGPGIMTYPDGRQDVGLWHRNRLLQMCSTLEDGFTLEDFPDHVTRLPEKHLKQPQLPVDPVESVQGLSEDEERFILPPDIERYSTDSDHLPVPSWLRRELDLHFFGTSDIRTDSLLKEMPLQQRMNTHIQRHSFETELLDWDVAAILNMNRAQFGPKGPLELNSEKLIHEASCGECRNVYRLLRDGKVHPDVSDALGHTALIAATARCHDDVINMLLDSGADVNQLNVEGLSALSVCTVLYYPPQSLHKTLAEKLTHNISPEPQIKEDVAHESSPDPMTERDKDERGPETFETPRQTNQGDQSLEQENNSEELEAQEQISEDQLEEQPKGQPEDQHECHPEEDQPEDQHEDHPEEDQQGDQFEDQHEDHPAEDQPGDQPEDQHEDHPEEDQPVDQHEDHREEDQPEDHPEEDQPGDQPEDQHEDQPEEDQLEDVPEDKFQDLLEDYEEDQPEDHLEDLAEDPPEGHENTDSIKEVILQSEDEENKPSDVIMSRSIQVFDGSIPVGSVSWREGAMDRDEDLAKSIRSDGPTFDSACSLVSFKIDVTEEILQKSAEILCRMGAVSLSDTRETVRKIALLKTEHRNRWNTIKLLLERGADPNASTVPMPVLSLAIKAAHVEGVRRLLECGARTDLPLLPQHKGLYPLHIAAGLSGAAGPEITELLLHALADPDAKAQDAQEVYEFDEKVLGEDERVVTSGAQGKGSDVQFPVEAGRTALHVACQKDTDYNNARDVAALLLSHNASPNEVWSGQSPLSLAIASGNDLVVEELLYGGADPNLPLGGHMGSALCALANIRSDGGPQPRNRVKLLEKLMKAGADILMPVSVFDGRRWTMGTVVDYAHLRFQQNKRMSHMPYHALNRHERQAYSTSRELLSIMGDLLRWEAERREQEQSQDESGVTSSLLSSPEINGRTSVKNRAGQKVSKKPRFKYCSQCGRSVGVQLSACNRSRQVYYCSKTCKSRAWDERHRDECLRPPSVNGKNSGGKSETVCPRSPPSAKDTKGKTFHLNVPLEIPEYDQNENYSFI